MVSASVGIASARDAIAGAADLVRNADVAMYMAKANGKSGFSVFDPGMHEAMRERHELSVDLQRAADLDQLALMFQPIVDLRTGGLAGVEALVRWHPPDARPDHAGPLHRDRRGDRHDPPDRSLGPPPGLPRGRRWLADGRVPPETFVSVNVSAREIQQLGFVDGVKAVLGESGLDPKRLVLEITETALLRATPATVATLEAVRAMGVRTVIDDFGTGYFSLSHLRQFPVDALKIAKEFVQDVDEASKSSALAGAIIAMSRSLGIETVAEGIETSEQADRMQRLGCAVRPGLRLRATDGRGRPAGGLRDLLDGPAAVEATTSGRREANGRAANASRRPATPKSDAPARPVRRAPALRPASS